MRVSELSDRGFLSIKERPAAHGKIKFSLHASPLGKLKIIPSDAVIFPIRVEFLFDFLSVLCRRHPNVF